MPKTYGFKKQTKVESPKKTPKTYNDYIYNIGDELKGPDLDERIERFEATYPAKRPEYHGFSFTANIRVDGQIIEKEVAVPAAEVARSIHAHCEFGAHPITANQKLQPNYVKSNVRDGQPTKVGNLKVSAVGYFNRVQQQIGLPNYTRIKAQTIQKELFKHHLMYKDVGKRTDYPAVADLDYSEQTFAHMKRELSNSTQYGLTCGGSRLMENTADQCALQQALPDILHYAPKDVKERNEAGSSGTGMNNGNLSNQNDDGMQGLEANASLTTSKRNNRKKKTKSKRVKFADDAPASNVRRSPRNKEKKASKNDTAKRGEAVKRTLAQVYDDPDEDDSSADNTSEDSGNDEEEPFDLFASTVKQDWSKHPKFDGLMTTGMMMIKQIGFMSPKTGQKSKKTMKSLAKSVGIMNIPSRATAEPLIVRAMAIARIKKMDADSEDMYSDLNADAE